jgi:hypothetical protein
LAGQNARAQSTLVALKSAWSAVWAVRSAAPAFQDLADSGAAFGCLPNSPLTRAEAAKPTVPPFDLRIELLDVIGGFGVYL